MKIYLIEKRMAKSVHYALMSKDETLLFRGIFTAKRNIFQQYFFILKIYLEYITFPVSGS